MIWFATNMLFAVSKPMACPPALRIITVTVVTAIMLGGCGRGPQGQKGDRGPPGPKGDPGPAGAGIRVIKADCNERGCIAQCGTDEMLLTAYCGPKRNAAVIPSERSATCRSPVPANSPIVAACVKMAPE
jgi:hypothetical protein